jgi:hypothetical protein
MGRSGKKFCPSHVPLSIIVLKTGPAGSRGLSINMQIFEKKIRNVPKGIRTRFLLVKEQGFATGLVILSM